jgi:hypothetical protein
MAETSGKILEHSGETSNDNYNSGNKCYVNWQVWMPAMVISY